MNIIYFFGIFLILVKICSSICNDQQCDWEKEGYVTDIKNQNPCKACWAFAVIAVFEWFYRRYSGTLTTFSEQFLIDCGYLEHEKLGRCGPHVGIASGGDPMTAFRVIKNNLQGIYESSAYKWRGDDIEDCHDIPGADKYFPARGFTPRYIRAKATNEDLKKIIREYGVVLAEIYAPEEWYTFKGDQIYDKECHGKSDHVVAIIGYGVDAGRPYWLIKNSWGRDYGHEGKYKLLMRDDKVKKKDCGIKEKVIYLIPTE